MTYYEQEIRRLQKIVYPRQEVSRQVIYAKLYMDRHFGEKLDLDRIARLALISKYHFLRLFKGHYGMTPHHYLTYVRVGEAKQFLREGRSVAEVCMAVGFDSVSSFKGLFKRYTGVTPAGWQKSNFGDRTRRKVR
jgi:transcriptional regulator GlxA family with amidase domain